jgi:hypothetical protein
MGSLMKTTVEISDALLEAAKRLAAERGPPGLGLPRCGGRRRPGAGGRSGAMGHPLALYP